VGKTQTGSAQSQTDERDRGKKQRQKKEGIMKMPWAICSAILVVFLVCNVAGATDERHSEPQKTPAYVQYMSKDYKDFTWNPSYSHKIINPPIFSHNVRHGHPDKYGHHHDHGYCNPNFEIFCQRKCGDVSPTSCDGHKGFGKHCTPNKLKKCVACGFISK
jgi:hypothetical protein